MKRVPLKRTGRLRPISERRRAMLEKRQEVRRVVYEREGGVCAGWGIAGVPHSHTRPVVPWEMVEIHELRRGQRRASDWLNPKWCVVLCPAAHRWVTVDGYPEPAHSLGLVLRSWETDPVVAAERRSASLLRRDRWS